MLNKIRPDIEGEMDELQRVSQDLSRDENINISVEDLVKAFNESNEETLIKDIWSKLENTESNEIEKGDWDSVMEIAKNYKKTNPKKLKKVIENGDYKRPLILKLGDRYILVAGNTRLCTAAAMGVEPKVFIGKIQTNSELNESEELKGGLSDRKSLKDIASKHTYDDATDSVDKGVLNNMLKHLKDQLRKGMGVESEHTNNEERAREIVMDHLWEDPNYYTKLSKADIEETDASSSGEYSGQAFGKILTKGEIYKLHNADLTEAVDGSASGEYDVPLFGATTKGNKNPLKIGGPETIYKGRAVKDKKFPKFGGPEGIYVKIKEKCKKYPYCNQGNTGALEFIREDKELQTAIIEISKKYGLQHSDVENIVLNEISKIFI
jgi:hypothetical protein